MDYCDVDLLRKLNMLLAARDRADMARRQAQSELDVMFWRLIRQDRWLTADNRAKLDVLAAQRDQADEAAREANEQYEAAVNRLIRPN